MSKLGSVLASGALAFLFAAAVTGCHADSRHRVQYPDDHLSLEKLEGWAESRERGALVFSDRSGATIEIRTGEVGHDRPVYLDDLAASTQRLLDSVASAPVDPPVALDHATMTGALFRLSLLPPDRIGPYGGRHVVLLGEHHFYHVMLAAPELELASATETFFQTVLSLREE